MTETVRVRAPILAPGEWINSPPLTLEGLRGGVVLVDIWDMTCINCLRTLPYLREWHRRYKNHGLTVLGVHCPEFRFARDKAQVEAAARRLDIDWPVLLDNDYQTWTAFANRYWPTKYLIDAKGYLRYQKSGEGAYGETETALQALLRESQPGLELPQPIAALREEDQPGAVCYKTTPELHAGHDRGALGNPEGYGLPAPPVRADSHGRGVRSRSGVAGIGRAGGKGSNGLPVIYRLPRQRLDGNFYAEGTWQAGAEHLAFAGREGALVLPYHAASANAVLSPSPDPVELLLGLKPAVSLEVTQDGLPLPSAWAGEDIRLDLERGRSYVTVDAPRLYALTRNPDAGPHELRLSVTAPGLAVFAFTFTTCVTP